MSDVPDLRRASGDDERELLVGFLSWLADQGVRTLKWGRIAEPDYPDVPDREAWLADPRTPAQQVEDFLASRVA